MKTKASSSSLNIRENAFTLLACIWIFFPEVLSNITRHDILLKTSDVIMQYVSIMYRASVVDKMKIEVWHWSLTKLKKNPCRARTVSAYGSTAN